MVSVGVPKCQSKHCNSGHTVEVVGTEIWRLWFLCVPFDVDVPFVREGDGGRLRLVSCIGSTEKGMRVTES